LTKDTPKYGEVLKLFANVIEDDLRQYYESELTKEKESENTEK